jgi:hypothetical protein
MSTLFVEAGGVQASGPLPSLFRDLLPGHADEHTAYFMLQYLVPFMDTTNASAPIAGYPVEQGQVQATPVTLGTNQGSGVTAAAQGLAGTGTYLADGGSNSIAGYSVDLQSSIFTDLAGAPFSTSSAPVGVTVDPSGRFLYTIIGSNVTAYSLTLGSGVPQLIGAVPVTGTNPAAISSTRQCVFVANTGSGGYEVYSINQSSGALTAVSGSPFTSHQAQSIARTPNGNFAYFSNPNGTIDGFFVDPSTCGLTSVHGSPFGGPTAGILRVNEDTSAIYSAGSGIIESYSLNAATGEIENFGLPTLNGTNTGAMVVGPKGLVLWTADVASGQLAGFTLDQLSGQIKGHAAAVTGPTNVHAMLLMSENGTQLIGKGVAQNRTEKVIGGAPPYSFALTGGSLPKGLTFNAALGAIVGTPTTLGQSQFEITVTDGVGHTSVATHALKVVTAPAVPAAPSNLTATVDSPTEVTLSWTDNAHQTAGFLASLSQDGGTFTDVQAAGPADTSMTISGLSPATAYTFKLRAVNAAGGTTDSTSASAVTTPATGAGCGDTDFGQCLLDGRFFVEAIFQDEQGDQGLAHVVSVTSDTAYLWFFGSTNVEAVVKILDGCGLGGHYWVFAGGLTNVHVILRVTDTHSGAQRYYEVPNGPAFQPIQDTAALGNCPSAGAVEANSLPESTASVTNSRLFTQAAMVAHPGNQGFDATAVRPSASSTCTPGDGTLCLSNSRFQVTATFNAGAQGSGNAHVGSLTPDTGYLWFFASTNIESVIKVIDGCPVNGHYWVFAGGLTNVGVTITVTDTATGASTHYTNPANTTFEPVQDTTAFSTCP